MPQVVRSNSRRRRYQMPRSLFCCWSSIARARLLMRGLLSPPSLSTTSATRLQTSRPCVVCLSVVLMAQLRYTNASHALLRLSSEDMRRGQRLILARKGASISCTLAIYSTQQVGIRSSTSSGSYAQTVRDRSRCTVSYRSGPR